MLNQGRMKAAGDYKMTSGISRAFLPPKAGGIFLCFSNSISNIVVPIDNLGNYLYCPADSSPTQPNFRIPPGSLFKTKSFNSYPTEGIF